MSDPADDAGNSVGATSAIPVLCLLKATAKNYLREAQQHLIVPPLLERLQPVFSQSLEAHLSKLLRQLQGQPLAETGYAGGNLLNLLVTLNPNLSDRDFSQLAIMQAYLAGIEPI